MTQSFAETTGHLRESNRARVLQTGADTLAPRFNKTRPRIRYSSRSTADVIGGRWANIDVTDAERQTLADPVAIKSAPLYAGNIENYIGTTKIPTGLAGPLRVNGTHAQDDYYVPLATTEGTLIASFARGMDVITASGGCAAMVLAEGVSRVPVFIFENISQAGAFVSWVTENLESLASAAEATTRYGKLIDLTFNIEGNAVYITFTFRTGDASGQNMVTIAADAACRSIVASSPVKPKSWYVEANMSGDKKASARSFQTVRGRKVAVEVIVPHAIVRRKLRSTPETMTECWRLSVLGGVMSGTIGVQGHVSNGLAALYLATGQDVATVAEAAVGITKMEVTTDGDLQACITMPNIIVGTVGGGTGLPSQHACLVAMNLAGSGKAAAFAEVTAAVCLAGELSITAAIAAGHFTCAHQKLGRTCRANS